MTNAKFLLVVFDGLRRELITPELMPNLDGFRKAWVDCPESRSVNPSETRVQVASFVTGAYPGSPHGHGIMGNAFYDPSLGFDGPMDTSDQELMARAATYYGGSVMSAPDLGAVLATAGKTYVSVSTGKIGNARLLNLEAAARGQASFSIHGNHISSPAAEHDKLLERFGPVPESAFPNVAVADHATDLVLQHFIPNHHPDVLVLWYSEPDLSYHYRGLGSEEAQLAMAGTDRAFGRILDWWHSQGRADGWQIIAASDHAHITIEERFELLPALLDAGFAAGPAIGPDVDVAVKKGYIGTLFTRDRDPALTIRLLEWLREQPWCGMLFARDQHGEATGALDLALLNQQGERAPDIFFAGRTSNDADRHGLSGWCHADSPGLPLGGSTHGGLHPKEMNNFLAMGGNLFPRETVFPHVCGVVDVAPTILRGMGIAAPKTVHGRPLTGLFHNSLDEDIRDSLHQMGKGDYQQELRLGHAAGAARPYIHGGNRLS